MPYKHVPPGRAARVQALGLRVPEGLDAAAVAAALGPQTLMPTHNVATQRAGPRLTLGARPSYRRMQEE